MKCQRIRLTVLVCILALAQQVWAAEPAGVLLKQITDRGHKTYAYEIGRESLDPDSGETASSTFNFETVEIEWRLIDLEGGAKVYHVSGVAKGLSLTVSDQRMMKGVDPAAKPKEVRFAADVSTDGVIDGTFQFEADSSSEEWKRALSGEVKQIPHVIFWLLPPRPQEGLVTSASWEPLIQTEQLQLTVVETSQGDAQRIVVRANRTIERNGEKLDATAVFDKEGTVHELRSTVSAKDGPFVKKVHLVAK